MGSHLSHFNENKLPNISLEHTQAHLTLGRVKVPERHAVARQRRQEAVGGAAGGPPEQRLPGGLVGLCEAVEGPGLAPGPSGSVGEALVGALPLYAACREGGGGAA
jgi:hypothetical protein